MHSGAQRLPVERGNLLSRSPIAASVMQRAEQVVDLLHRRRKMALAYKRTQDEDERIALEQIDSDLAKYHIDIPAIQRAALVSKGAAAGYRSRHAYDGQGFQGRTGELAQSRSD
jgi:hypothetical protein